MFSRKKCKTCAYFEPLPTMPGRGWCRHPKVDPAGVGSRKLERANLLGCRDHRPVWWTSKADRAKQQRIRAGSMLFLLDE